MLAALLRRALRAATSRLRPTPHLGTLRRQAGAQARAKRHDLAAATLEHAVALAPRDAALWNKLGFARLEIGLVDDAIPAFREALKHDPADLYARRNLLFALILRSESPEELFAEHRACGALMELGLPYAQACAADLSQRGKLRVGYVSGDFARHAVALFMEPILERHDRTAFDITCYDNRAHGDDVTQRLQSYGTRWRAVTRLDDEALARLVRKDRIDILVDLSGHTARNRLGAFARRCAPVQVTYLGYLESTGLQAIDYRLTDALADPPDITDAHYVEKLVRLPGCLWCYRPPLPSVAAQWQPRHAVTFGSLNNSRKLSPRIVRLWSQLLQRVPGSRLLIACLPDGTLRQRILRELTAGGTDPGRIECLAWTTPEEFAAVHGRIDIGLDSFPCGGGTTTIEALWHGVPIVTLTGRTFPSRVGRSILSHAGLPQLAAGSETEFLAIASALAGDPARIARLHADLPQRLRASPIMDEAGFVRGLEQAYLAMWQSFICARAG
jgi:predicted O-linked N-acetylglucosamine transferase (SPINDLY family)